MKIVFRRGLSAALASLAGAATLAYGALAAAQDVAAGPSMTEEKQASVSTGMKLSDGLVFHPSVEVGGGYQTNVFFEDDVGGDDRIVSSPILRAGVGLVLQTEQFNTTSEPGEPPPPGPKVAFGSTMNFTWNQYLDDQAKDFSDVGIGALVNATFNPQGKVAPFVRGGYTRAVTPPRGLSVDDIDRDKIEAAVGLNALPGGGALTVYAEYRFTLDLFERSDLEFANRQSHNGTLGVRYQWLPKTQFFGETQVGYTAPDQASTLKSESAVPLRVSAGVLTLLTPSFGTVAKVGYGNSFNSDGPSFNSVTALIEGRLAIGPQLRTAFGYQRDFQDSIIANFYSEHTIYARLVAQLGNFAQLNVKGDLRFRTYEYADDMGPVVFMSPSGGNVTFCSDEACTGSDRSDTLYGVSAGVDVPVKDWIVLGASYSLLADVTDFQTRTPTADPAEFVWQEVLVKATARY